MVDWKDNSISSSPKVVSISAYTTPNLSLKKNKSSIAVAKKVTVRDADNALKAGRAVVVGTKKIIRDEEKREMISFLLDNKLDEERTEDEKLLFDGFFEFIEQVDVDKDDNSENAMLFTAADFSELNSFFGKNVDSILQKTSDDTWNILLSNELGFKDTILAAHFSYADFMVQIAEERGVVLKVGDVGRDLFTLLSTGDLPAILSAEEAPEIIMMSLSKPEGKRLSLPRIMQDI